jgi:hypothetical protein
MATLVIAWTVVTIAYGMCPCGGEYEARLVEVRMGERTLSDVPQGACPLCGSRVYRGDVLAVIEAFYREFAAPRASTADTTP